MIRNLVVAGRRTSVRLEPAMWDAFNDIARYHRVTVHDLVTMVDRDRAASSLTAAIRVFIVDYYRGATTIAGVAETARPLRLPA